MSRRAGSLPNRRGCAAATLVTLQRPEASENKRIFDELAVERRKSKNASAIVSPWRRMDDSKASRIVFSRQFDGSDESQLGDMAACLCEHFVRLERGVAERRA